MFGCWKNRLGFLSKFHIGHRTRRTWLCACTRNALAMTFHSKKTIRCTVKHVPIRPR